jgi:hypothetical protein
VEGRLQRCGWFQLSDRARRGDMADIVFGRVARHGECNREKIKNENSKTKAEERRGRRGSKQGGSFEFFLTTSF